MTDPIRDGLYAVAEFHRLAGNATKFRACEESIKELERFREIVECAPKCWRLNESGELVQDVPALPGMAVYYTSDVTGEICDAGVEIDIWGATMRSIHAGWCANSREAAEQLAKKMKGKP